MTVIIKGSGLTIEDVVGVARHGDKIELHKEAVEKINKCREMLENKIAAGFPGHFYCCCKKADIGCGGQF